MVLYCVLLNYIGIFLNVTNVNRFEISEGDDVQISTYSADGRGAVSAALKKR